MTPVKTTWKNLSFLWAPRLSRAPGGCSVWAENPTCFGAAKRIGSLNTTDLLTNKVPTILVVVDGALYFDIFDTLPKFHEYLQMMVSKIGNHLLKNQVPMFR